MDLLGDIGTHDQLIATRTENELLKQKVSVLTQQVQSLTLQLTIAQAEIELYRNDYTTGTSTTGTDVSTTTQRLDGTTPNPTTVSPISTTDPTAAAAVAIVEFTGSSNNIVVPQQVLPNLHNNSNPICVSIVSSNGSIDIDDSNNNIIIVTGGADATIRFTRYNDSRSSSTVNTISTTTSTNSNIVRGTNDDTLINANTTIFDTLTAPVVCMTTIHQQLPRWGNINTSTCIFDTYVVAGTMDGHIALLQYDDINQTTILDHSSFSSSMSTYSSSSLQPPPPVVTTVLKKHDKYVSSISWILNSNDTNSTSTSSWLATSGADGTIHIYSVTLSATVNHDNNIDRTMEHDDNQQQAPSSTVIEVRHIESLYFDDPVTCICYAQQDDYSMNSSGSNTVALLYVYVRNTPHIKVIRMPSVVSTAAENDPGPSMTDSSVATSGCNMVTTLHLNDSIYDHHVSFAILDMKLSSCSGQYLAVACDNHCHFIIDISSSISNAVQSFATTTSGLQQHQQKAKIIRKLYGHVADSYSRPVLAWSYNNQYIYCNTQNDTHLCVYSVASGKLVDIDASEQQQQFISHVRPIKDIYSHPTQNLLITTSFDRKTIVRTPPQQHSHITTE